MNILVLGATGYIGNLLVPQLLANGHRVSCLVRSRKRIEEKSWHHSVRVFEGDVLDESSLPPAMAQIDVLYYLVHSMDSPRGDFVALDRTAALNTGRAAKLAGVKRIIYLGGLGERDREQSPHLRSRHEVGDVLRTSGVAVTEFRAAVIVGAGSLSFEMVHHLANRLPVMICPRWVVTKTQPIAVSDVLAYLAAAVTRPESAGKVMDIGGPEVLTYRDMMLRVARVLGLRRWLIEVPVLTPRLSSYWVGLVTPVPIKPARALIEGLRHETVCRNNDAATLFGIKPTPFDEAVAQALQPVLPDQLLPAHARSDTLMSRVEPWHFLSDRRRVAANASADRLFEAVSSIGGDNGWYAANALWKMRGWLDELLGGVGLRRGRRHPDELAVGDALDFWRVEELEPGRRLLLRAEMKVPGRAWLEWEVEASGPAESVLKQTAVFYPRGLAGIAYWYSIYPVHVMVFRRLAKAIARKAEMLTT